MFNSTIDFLFRVYRIIGRLIIKYSFNPRPASYPFISGDGFRKLADYIYDNRTKNVAVDKIKEKDIIFVGDSNIKKFLTEFHPKIKVPYILITHNGDEAIGDELAGLIDEKIIKWYGLNVIVNHPKVIPLPIGIANRHYYVGGILWVFRWVMKKNYPKKDRIFYGFMVETNFQERQPAFQVLKSNPLAETVMQWIIYPRYLHLLAKYKFVASPPGSSVEGHRTWDAMYLKTIPIVKGSITTEYFKKLNIPVWVVDDWNELVGLTGTDLAKKYNDIMAQADWSKIFMNYWKNEILKLKD